MGQQANEGQRRNAGCCLFVCLFVLCVCLFPTCQVRVVRFYQSYSPLLFSSTPPPPRLLDTTAPLLPAPDRSGLYLNCTCMIHRGHSRTPTASARSQWAPPDLNGKCQMAVVAGHRQIECQSLCQIEYMCQIYFPDI